MSYGKSFVYLIAAIFFMVAGYAFAQSTALQAVIGTQSVVNGFASWTPISITNPLPVISQ